MKLFINTPFIQTYKGLMKTIHQLVGAAFGEKKLMFTAAYPNELDLNNVKSPIITYYSKKSPEMLGGKTQELKPRPRGSFISKNEEGEDVPVQIMGQKMEYLIIFEVWGRNGLEADEMADNFEMFMATYTPYLTQKGVCHVGFINRDDEPNQNQWRNDLVKRKLTYKIIMDQISSVVLDSIKTYDIILVINNDVFDSIINNTI